MISSRWTKHVYNESSTKQFQAKIFRTKHLCLSIENEPIRQVLWVSVCVQTDFIRVFCHSNLKFTIQFNLKKFYTAFKNE